MARDDAIGLDEQRARRAVNAAQRQHQAFQLGHVERRRRALPRYIRDQHAQTALTERKKIVVVAPHFASRRAERRHRQAGHAQLALRQQRHLDAARNPQLLLEPALLVALFEQLADAARHLVERQRQIAELIVGAGGDAPREIAALHMLGAGEQVIHRVGNRSRQRQAVAERHHFNHQQQRPDADQREQQNAAECDIRRSSLVSTQPAVQRADSHIHRHGSAAWRAVLPVCVGEERRCVEEGSRLAGGRLVFFLLESGRRGSAVGSHHAQVAQLNARRLQRFCGGFLVHRQVYEHRVIGVRAAGQRRGARRHAQLMAVGPLQDQQAGKSAAADPSRQRTRRIRRGEILRRHQSASRVARGRHHRERNAGIPRLEHRLPPAEHVLPTFERRALHLDLRGSRERRGLIREAVQPASHEIRADVEEHQKKTEQREGHEQQKGNRADEDVRQDQLPAHAPQQPGPYELRELVDGNRRESDEREIDHAVDDLERGRAAGHPDRDDEEGLDDKRGEKAAAGPRRD